MEYTNEKVILPNIIGHTSSDGCYNGVDIYGNPIFSEPFNFIDEKEKLKYGPSQYCEFSYDNEGNCTVTKKLCKTLQ